MSLPLASRAMGICSNSSSRSVIPEKSRWFHSFICSVLISSNLHVLDNRGIYVLRCRYRLLFPQVYLLAHAPNSTLSTWHQEVSLLERGLYWFHRKPIYNPVPLNPPVWDSSPVCKCTGLSVSDTW